jgi:drug/metabolite transporter (DMT)-like permease
MTLHLGILLALFCAFLTNLGFFYKHRGAREAPPVDVRHPLATAKGLWGSKWFAVGMGIGAGGWMLHVAAVSLAPLSVVQVVLSGGVVLIAVMADRLFGFEVGRRQWWGLALTAIGLILLGVTMPTPGSSHSTFSLAAMIAFEAGLFGLVAAFGSAAAFYASARSLQDGDAVSVIAITGTAANISTIAGGIIVFGDPMPGDAFGIVLQGIAFVLVIVASALTPAPVRSAQAAAAATA